MMIHLTNNLWSLNLRHNSFIAFGLYLCIILHPGNVYGQNHNTIVKNDKAEESTIINLTIDKAINLAILANRNIISSGYNAQSQQFSIASAKSEFDIKLIPTVTTNLGGGSLDSYSSVGAGLSFQKKLESGAVVSVGPTINKIDQQYNINAGFTIQQPLFKRFGKDANLDNVLTAEASYRTATRNIYQTKVNAILETVSVYYNGIKQKETTRLYESMGQRLKGHAAVAKSKEKVGLATAMDTYRAEINLKDAEDSLLQAIEAYKDIKDRLKIVLSLSLKTEVDLTPPEKPPLMKVELSDAIETALKNRMEITQIKAELEEAERKAAVLKHNINPDISLILGYGRFSVADAIGQSVSFGQERWSIGIQGVTDLSYTAEKSAYQQGLLAVKMVQLNLEAKTDEINKEVRKQFLALREAEKRIFIRKEQIKQAEEKLALAEVKYAHGMANNFDVIEAETELQRSRVNLLSAEIDYAVGTYNMKAILGVLIPRT